MQENMWNLAKYAAHICGIYAAYAAFMLHMPHLCSIFIHIFPAYANLSDGIS